MTNEIDNARELDVLPPARPLTPRAVEQLKAHAESMAFAKQLADALCATDMVPADYKGKPGNGAAAILYGAELGLDPIQSLQQIFVVHGRPAIYARTAAALLKNRGVILDTVTTSDTEVTVKGTDTRTGQTEQSTWTIERATKAGYAPERDEKTGKYKTNANGKLLGNEKYLKDPQAMLYAKAAMDVARKLAPDVLLGVPLSVEESELEGPTGRPAKVRSERPTRGLAALNDAIRSTAQVVADAPTLASAEEQQPDIAEPAPESAKTTARQKWEMRLDTLLDAADCTNLDDQRTVLKEITGVIFEFIPDGLDDVRLRSVVNVLNDWSKEGRLGETVTEILNAAALAEVNNETLED